MPSMPIGVVGSSRANRISCRRSPGRMPVNVISMSRPGSRPGQPDHPLGEIDDLHRLAHVEHIDRDIGALARERVARRRHDQIAGFADGHEVAHHVGMRDRHRPAGLDLRLELRHHRTVRRQHVAEPHRDQPHGAAPARRDGVRTHCRAPGNTFRQSAWRRRAPRPARSPCRSRSSPWRRRRRRRRRRRH